MNWAPHVTVAAVAERDGHFLCVRETVDGGTVINQPAGHLEPGESLIDAVVRETREETAWCFTPRSLIGVYRWHCTDNDRTYLRFAFAGTVDAHDPAQPLDEGIIEALWLSVPQLEHDRSLRSPLVLQCVRDYLNGKSCDLALLCEIEQ